MEILFILEGSAIQQINDKNVEVNVNDIIILHQGDTAMQTTAVYACVRILSETIYINYKVSQICLILAKSCWGQSGCLPVKLHMISFAICSKSTMNKLIKRLRIEIKTANECHSGIYGFDETFSDGLNFIASLSNTSGKSSVIEAIFYCLGFEEIIGARKEKVLTSVYKSIIKDSDKEKLSNVMLQYNKKYDDDKHRVGKGFWENYNDKGNIK